LKVKEIVEAALLYVGVPAITLYPLGFVALGLQMWRDPSSRTPTSARSGTPYRSSCARWS
jgi:hypothetical protein